MIGMAAREKEVVVNQMFNTVNNFMGFGEPLHAVWFIGIEEHSSWGDDAAKDAEALKNIYSKTYCPSGCSAGEHTSVYDIMSKIMVGLEGSGLMWRDYRDKKLLQEGGGTFQTNLLPLGKPKSKKWLERYGPLFDINANEYRTAVRESRYPRLRDFWRANEPKLTICFGTTESEDFEMLLQLGNESPELHAADHIEVFRNPRVILTPFFRPTHMSDARIAELVRIAKGLL